MRCFMNKSCDLVGVNDMRLLSLDMINEAGSGHPGICLGAASIVYTLFKYHLRFNAGDSKFFNRDYFIMSAGHGSALLYSSLFYFGYDYDIDDLIGFRKISSKTPGHPEYDVDLGIEM